jgi:hypothetical protein
MCSRYRVALVEESLVPSVEVGELADELVEKVGATEGVPVGLDEREEDIVTASRGS